MSKFDFINEEITFEPKVPSKLLEKVVAIHGILGYHDEEWGGIRLEHRNIYSLKILEEMKKTPPDFQGYEIRLIFILEDGKTFASSIFSQNGICNP
jgi:hypothetical protein